MLAAAGGGRRRLHCLGIAGGHQPEGRGAAVGARLVDAHKHLLGALSQRGMYGEGQQSEAALEITRSCRLTA